MLTPGSAYKRLFRLSTLLLLLACALLSDGAWILAKAWLAEGLIAAAWSITGSPDERIQPWSWTDTWPIARLEVPRLGVKRHILAGVSGRTLAFAPGWAMQTAAPGTSGSSLIAGHRDSHFRFLKDLQYGVRLLLDTPDRSRVIYRVTATAIVVQRQDRLKTDPEGRPFEALLPGGDLRFVVWAEAEPGELFGLESMSNHKITTGPNEADPNIPSSGLSTSRLSG